MPRSQPVTQLDSRFSEPAAEPTSWSDAVRVLEGAELYWLTTVQIDGRPHVTPLIGVLQDDAVFRIEPVKVLAFAKQPQAQTTYRFTTPPATPPAAGQLLDSP